MRDIVRRAKSAIEKGGIETCDCGGCFDLAAKKGRELFVFKVLSNVDSIQEEQARSLKIISKELESKAFIIGERTRKERLEEGVFYQRFDIPTLCMETLEGVLMQNSLPMLSRNRGGLFVEIDSAALKRKRVSLGMTQEELAEKAGTTKKGIYEHERESKKATKELADSLEKILGKVTIPSRPAAKEAEKMEPHGAFEGMVARHFDALGFETNSVYQAPFNLIAKSSDIIILSEAEENKKLLEKMAEDMMSFSRLSGVPIIAVTKGKIDMDFPTIQEKDLGGYSSKDLRNMAKGWK